MKKLIVLLSLTCFLYCDKENKTQETEKYFDPDKLELLDLANIEGFWEQGEYIDTSYSIGSIFENRPGFLDGIRLYSESKAVWITIFSTQDSAINAMEYRINNVAGVIFEGTSDIINGLWWYSISYPAGVYLIQWNTILEIKYYNTRLDEVEPVIYNIANEVAGRVDELSE
ncbi:MAG: hypothetical protein JW894_03530 [Bacteroidales bacterium]|nr:hypothetical protein [Bacteroidales bacterium]